MNRASFLLYFHQNRKEALSISVFLKLTSGQNALDRIIKTSPSKQKSFIDSFLSKLFDVCFDALETNFNSPSAVLTVP